jgi:hypothetical protein
VNLTRGTRDSGEESFDDLGQDKGSGVRGLGSRV